ncbi:MerR family transcriptional regulator [Marinilabilia salmonicolor]|jgi:DNA-binding transcriptional MerR regulator|uniref:DNA-binding transcriptional MerR regulator n=1 Tax=Marinilabilia salmonicolor TaxID=989 RepID=A0A368V2J7_9BACT|nr:MerR family transcriptional regulator [Marinilabilia salmonicolor]RCW34585.1 DNA-binding transcriptional MerR regulator [Marinilabilia salmonicolor]
MAVYSIKDLEKISGIKAHTIRIWERRYGLVEPKRTATNIRYYSDIDLKKLLNISILNQNGFKISKIAELDDHQLRDRVLDLCVDARSSGVQIESLMVSMLELDERKFLNVLSGTIIKYGFEDTLEKVLFPFLDRIGVLWQAGTINPSQEHFISNLIRQKLIVAIDNEMQNVSVNGPRITFFLPEGELHEIGLLFYNLMARKEGLDVVYLGQSVPLVDLKVVNQARPADAFFVSFVSAREKEEIEKMLQNLRDVFPDTPFMVNGLQIRELQPKLPEDFTVVSSIRTFKESIRLLKYSE